MMPFPFVKDSFEWVSCSKMLSELCDVMFLGTSFYLLSIKIIQLQALLVSVVR
jgi:hypothetical protein